MKKKTIHAVLSKKHKEWLASIKDENVRELASKGTIITGGCIASMLLKEKVNDFDLYFTDHDTALALATYYVNEFVASRNARGIETPITILDEDGRIKVVIKSAGIAGQDDPEYKYFESQPEGEAEAYIEHVTNIEGAEGEAKQATDGQETNPPFQPVFISTNAIMLSGKIQLIFRFYGSPEEIHANYDFVHCTNYWTPKTGVVLNLPAMESLMARELRYVGSKYPLCSIFRTRKFIKRGWTINAGQMLKMAMQLNELDLANLEVLEDQLTGVDVAYFLEVINKLKEKDPSKVNTAYLVEIIDRMF